MTEIQFGFVSKYFKPNNHCMQYINPFELLNITTTNPESLNGNIVNKAKKIIFAEIDLSDTNTNLYKGIELTKSDCIRITDDLDEKDKCEFHLFILQDKHLNEFLCNGSLSFFDNFRFEYIYKQPEFLDFISPFFSEKYNNLLTENVIKKNFKNVTKILSVKPIINEEYFDLCYRGTYLFLRNIDVELNKVFKDIENNQGQFIERKFESLSKLISEKIDIKILNILPNYFQWLRNQLAQTIRNLSTVVNNEPHSCYESAFNIIEISNNILTDGLVKHNIIKAYNIIKKNNESILVEKEKEEGKANRYSTFNEIYKDEIDNYVDIMRQIDEIVWQINKKESKYINNKFTGLYDWLSLIIDIPKLNSQPKEFDEARKRIAIKLMQLSATIRNDFENIEISFKIIQLAATIELDNGTRNSINEERKLYGKPISTTPDLGNYLIFGYNLYGSTRYFSVLMIPLLPLNRYYVKSVNVLDKVFNKRRLRFYGELKLKSWQKIWRYSFIGGLSLLIIIGIAHSNKPTSNSNTTNYSSPSSSVSHNNKSKQVDIPFLTKEQYTFKRPLLNIESHPKLPVYAYPEMRNGNIIGCTNIYPRFNKNINNKLIISCGSNADVAVKMVDFRTEKCIRYVYIKKNTTYTIRNIPEGVYYVKIAYGNNWGVLENQPNCKGRFTSSATYKKGDDILDYNITNYEDGSYQVPSYSLQLDVIYLENDNSKTFNTNNISENDFYNESN